MKIFCPLCGKQLHVGKAEWYDFHNNVVSITIKVKHVCKKVRNQ